MKHNRVLNRPMFNRNNSAYGRGITSNLVTQQERQRFNYGGRVRAADGLPYNTILSGYPTGKSYSDTVKTTDPMTLNYWDTYTEGPSLDWLIEGENIKKEKIKKEIQEGSELSPAHPSERWKEEDIDIKVEPAELPTLPADPDSDQLYTPQEQKEKKSQMALAIAERLIGGSRDKWGSTAQMKNLSGAIGDIRKIADPSERREMLAKYKAWGEAQKERDVDVLEHQRKMSRDPEFQLEEMTAVKGADRVNAINQVYGTSIRKKDKKIEKDFKNGKLPEGFIMEDAGVYTILRNGKWEIISEEEIIKNSPRQKKKS